jgi:hypothetical protein
MSSEAARIPETVGTMDAVGKHRSSLSVSWLFDFPKPRHGLALVHGEDIFAARGKPHGRRIPMPNAGGTENVPEEIA